MRTRVCGSGGEEEGADGGEGAQGKGAGGEREVGWRWAVRLVETATKR